MSLEFQDFNILKEKFVRKKHFSLEFFHKYLYFKFMFIFSYLAIKRNSMKTSVIPKINSNFFQRK